MTRSKNRLIAGVCAGIAASLGIDPVLVRLAFVGAFVFFGVGLLPYLLLWIIVPNET